MAEISEIHDCPVIENSPKSPTEFAADMRNIYKEYWVKRRDMELGHVAMDVAIVELLRSLGYGEAVEIFENTPKYYA